MVEKPPKLITKLAKIVASFMLKHLESSMHPFVISIEPFSNSQMGEGKILNIGSSAVIMTKKILIITPTDKMLNAESVTI